MLNNCFAEREPEKYLEFSFGDVDYIISPMHVSGI